MKTIIIALTAMLVGAIAAYFLMPRTASIMNHSSISVRDYEKSRVFYDETLKELGYSRVMTIDLPQVQCAGYGPHKFAPGFWISPMGDKKEDVGNARGVHFAFLAPNRAAVDAWYNACIKNGGTDNGKPGPLPEYHQWYYGAFIIDPDGWRIEACCHGPK